MSTEDDTDRIRRAFRELVAAHPVSLLVRRAVACLLGERHDCTRCRRWT